MRAPSSKGERPTKRFLISWTFLLAIIGLSVYNVLLFGQSPTLPGTGNASQLVGLGQGKWKKSSPCQRKACLSDTCLSDDYTVWEEWKACKERQVHTLNWITKEIHFQKRQLDVSACESRSLDTPRRASRAKTISRSIGIHQNVVNVTTPFEEFIVENRHHLPWSMDSNFTAVLVEFRAFRRPLLFSIKNALDNLPVSWRVQIVGGCSILSLAEKLFPIEIAAGKIILTHAGREKMNQVRMLDDAISPSYLLLSSFDFGNGMLHLERHAHRNGSYIRSHFFLSCTHFLFHTRYALPLKRLPLASS